MAATKAEVHTQGRLIKVMKAHKKTIYIRKLTDGTILTVTVTIEKEKAKVKRKAPKEAD